MYSVYVTRGWLNTGAGVKLAITEKQARSGDQFSYLY
jgi:hypothetical protein